MRISGPQPSPLTSPMALQTSAPEAAAPPLEQARPVAVPPVVIPGRNAVTEPRVVNMVGARVELQPNEFAKVVAKLNETARIFNHTMRFEMTESNRVKVKVIDTTTGQVVREVPPEKLMEMFNRMEDVLGLVMDERV